MNHRITRRDFGRISLASGAGSILTGQISAHEQINSEFNGVVVGAQSYSFRDRSLDEAIDAMRLIGIGSCELWSGHVEPLRESRGAKDGRARLRAFRLETPLSFFEEIGAKFHEAGISLHSLNYSFRDHFSDEEIVRGFEMAKAMGASVLTASGTVSVAKRVNPVARQFGMLVGMHNHSRIRENEFATPDDFATASEGHDHIAVNLDVGHFVAAGFDPIDYIRRHHEKIVTLHIKDRKVNQGDNVPFGEGDTPLVEIFALLRDQGYGFPANIEYEYRGGDTVEEVRKCFEFCKRALDS